MLSFKYFILLQVWKVKWNVTGTILSSAGDDGKVRLWKGKNNIDY